MTETHEAFRRVHIHLLLIFLPTILYVGHFDFRMKTPIVLICHYNYKVQFWKKKKLELETSHNYLF